MTSSIVPYSVKIPLLNRGKYKNKYFVVVSYWRFAWLNQWQWHPTKIKNTFYAIRWIGHDKICLMHKIINPNGKIIDHKDRNPLNNCENNLRISTQQQNTFNKTSKTNSTSKYIGVSYKIKTFNVSTHHYVRHYWTAQIRKGKINREKYFPATKEGEIEAAKWRDAQAKELHGEYANLNFQG